MKLYTAYRQTISNSITFGLVQSRETFPQSRLLRIENREKSRDQSNNISSEVPLLLVLHCRK
jgi:hypothetical protein